MCAFLLQSTLQPFPFLTFYHLYHYFTMSSLTAFPFYSENMIYLSCSTNRLIVKIENEMSLILQLGKYFYSVQIQISKLDQLNETQSCVSIPVPSIKFKCTLFFLYINYSEFCHSLVYFIVKLGFPLQIFFPKNFQLPFFSLFDRLNMPLLHHQDHLAGQFQTRLQFSYMSFFFFLIRVTFCLLAIYSIFLNCFFFPFYTGSLQKNFQKQHIAHKISSPFLSQN